VLKWRRWQLIQWIICRRYRGDPLTGRALRSNVPRGGNHTFNIAPHLLDQDFSADGPNQKWAGDISNIWTSEGWLYLAIILDLHSRRVIGWAPSHRYFVSTAGQWSVTA
jgi:transposase InsO family protein